MAKASGSTRLVKPFPVSRQTLKVMFDDLMSTGDYGLLSSFVNYKTGAYYAQAKGRTPDDNEQLAAAYLVKQGISTALTPEGDIRFATATKPSGDRKYSDGIASVYTYEQKTIAKDAVQIVNNFKRGIEHAVDKRAEIAFIFDRYGLGHKEQVEKAMREYSLPMWGILPKAVIVMDRNGKAHEHHF